MGLKINVKVNEEIDETEITVFCQEETQEIYSLCDYIRQYVRQLSGNIYGKQCKVMINKIYYIESVDRKVFYYTEDACIESRDTLLKVEQNIRGSSFVRVSKNCLINISFLQSVEAYENHRLLATMKNGEQILVGRAYIQQLKRVVKEGICCGTL